MALISERASEKFFDINIFDIFIPFEILLGLITLLTLIYVILAAHASRLSNNLKTVPTLSLEYTAGSRGKLTLVNLSNKIAYEIKLKPLYLMNNVNGGIYKVIFDLPSKNYIDAKERIGLNEKKLKDGSVDELEDLAKVISQVGKRSLFIEFKDIQGITYYTVIEFSNGSEQIVIPPKKLDAYERMKIYIQDYKQMIKIKKYYKKKFDRQFPKKSNNS